MDIDEAQEFVNHVSNRDVTYEMNAKGCPFSDKKWAALKALYDAEIRYTDYYIGTLIERLERIGLKIRLSS